MERKMRPIVCALMTFGFQLVCVLCGRVAVYKKEEVATPSPPEGNTTFVGGTTWCVALKTVGVAELQVALDWACGPGSTDCTALQPGGPCFEPNTVVSHASFAFNSYYQQNGNSDIACNFGGAAIITRKNPSYASCVYLASESSSGSWSYTRRNGGNMGIRLLCYLLAGLFIV